VVSFPAPQKVRVAAPAVVHLTRTGCVLLYLTRVTSLPTFQLNVAELESCLSETGMDVSSRKLS